MSQNMMSQTPSDYKYPALKQANQSAQKLVPYATAKMAYCCLRKRAVRVTPVRSFRHTQNTFLSTKLQIPRNSIHSGAPSLPGQLPEVEVTTTSHNVREVGITTVDNRSMLKKLRDRIAKAKMPRLKLRVPKWLRNRRDRRGPSEETSDAWTTNADIVEQNLRIGSSKTPTRSPSVLSVHSYYNNYSAEQVLQLARDELQDLIVRTPSPSLSSWSSSGSTFSSHSSDESGELPKPCNNQFIVLSIVNDFLPFW